MPNMITPVGSRIYGDSTPLSEAQRQDRERRARDDAAYEQRTGIRRPPIMETSFLVGQNETPDVANDGDGYIENNPSVLNTAALSSAFSVGEPEFNLDTVVAGSNTQRLTPRTAPRNRSVTKEVKLSNTDQNNKDIKSLIEKNKEEMGNLIEGLDF